MGKTVSRGSARLCFIAENPKKGKGTAMPNQEEYQLAPDVTKNAPDRNLRTSLQLIFMTQA
jgi:hypothetical protein